MIDITIVEQGKDMQIYDTQVGRAANILSVQIGDLEYAQALGIDLRYFLAEDFKFENSSFRAYLVETLANWGVNVSSVTTVIEALYNRYLFNLAPEENSTGLIAR